MTDKRIVELFFERDEYAIQGCDDKYGRPLRTLGNRITNDSHTTDECADDTYMRVWQTVPPTDPQNYLFAFLSKIMRNICFDRIKALSRAKRGAQITVLSTELSEAAPDIGGADRDALRKELSSLIEKFVSNLKEETRQIFVMRYFYMDDLSTISKRLVITEGKVKTVLKRTRDKLRIYLETYGYHA